MDSLTYLKITFQPDSFPAYHFYYILYKDQLIKYDIILNGSFSIDFGFYDSESIDETMIEYSIITESEEINAINIFLQYFHNSFDILEYIYKKINNNDNEEILFVKSSELVTFAAKSLDEIKKKFILFSLNNGRKMEFLQ